MWYMDNSVVRVNFKVEGWRARAQSASLLQGGQFSVFNFENKQIGTNISGGGDSNIQCGNQQVISRRNGS
jgi:hypothetical protein